MEVGPPDLVYCLSETRRLETSYQCLNSTSEGTAAGKAAKDKAVAERALANRDNSEQDRQETKYIIQMVHLADESDVFVLPSQ